MSVRQSFHYKPKPQSEREFQSQVVKLAKIMHWRIYHTYDSRRSEPGFPDLILIKGNRMLTLELKTKTGKPSKEQLEWLEAFANVKEVHSALYRPENFEEIKNLLTA